jgi:deoxyribonuclease V
MRSSSSRSRELDSILHLMAEIQKAVAKIAYPADDMLADARTVCAVDVAYGDGDCIALALVYDFGSRSVIETAHVRDYVLTPYIPGFLVLREAVPMADAVRRLTAGWDVLLVDGHGRAHPRMAGLATFLGFLLGRPSVGVAKRLLVGEVGPYDQGVAEVRYDGAVVGYAVKQGERRPFYVSQGYGVSLGDIRRVIQLFGMDYPAAIREAHLRAVRLVNEG